MTVDKFRRIALNMPEATEKAHMGHPDFRVGGKIFATLGYPSADLAMVKLTPEQQREFVLTEPEMFTPVSGGWGLKGATHVRLRKARESAVRDAVAAAWRNVAPKSLLNSSTNLARDGE